MSPMFRSQGPSCSEKAPSERRIFLKFQLIETVSHAVAIGATPPSSVMNSRRLVGCAFYLAWRY
jgi:hypothetical protein